MILVCGEALFDVFLAGERPDGLDLDARPGGSPFNVAVGLARLGREAGLFTGLSTDWLGGRLAAVLEREGVDTRWLRRLDRPATVSFVGLGADGSPSYAFYGEGAADRALSGDDLPVALDGVKALHLGSYTAAVEPVASTQHALLDLAQGCLVSYDPNIRPTVEPDLERWRRAVARMTARADLVKVSREDLETLYPGTPVETIAAGWLDAGVALVIVTDGGRGAQAWTGRAQASVGGEAVSVVDSVGAGDTFQAALLAALDESGRLSRGGLEGLDGEGLEYLLAFAGRAAALVVSRRGADMPRRDELPALAGFPPLAGSSPPRGLDE